MPETNGVGAPTPVKAAALFASEVVVPGGSNLVTGNISSGIGYAAVGLLAKAMIGLPALILVSASSFSKATTGRDLTDVVRSVGGGGDQKARIAELNAKIEALEAKLEAATGSGHAEQ